MLGAFAPSLAGDLYQLSLRFTRQNRLGSPAIAGFTQRIALHSTPGISRAPSNHSLPLLSSMAAVETVEPIRVDPEPYPLKMTRVRGDPSDTAEHSVQLVGGQLLAQGRPVLSNVPDNVACGACCHVDTPASQKRDGAFVGASFMEDKSRQVFSLGTLRDVRFLCCFRFKLWWMTQRVGSQGREIPFETQFLLLECPPAGEAAHPGDARFPRQGAGSDGQPWERRRVALPSEPLYVVVLPLLEGAFRASLQGGLDDALQVCVESGDPSVHTKQAYEAVYIHAGANPYQAISEAIRAVEAHSGSFTRRELKMLPGLLDNFGWCTWDAFYTDVTAQGVDQGLTSLAEGGTPAKFLIIDDGWQTVSADAKDGASRGYGGLVTAGTQYASRLTDLRENSKFKSGSVSASSPHPSTASSIHTSATPAPSVDSAAAASVPPIATTAAPLLPDALPPPLAGLGQLVRSVKAKHGLNYVYVWHALLGYWGGVKPGQHGMERFDALLTFPVPSHGVLANQPDMADDTLTVNGVGVVHPGQASAFYQELHSYLASCGVDGVKVDVQNILETLGAGHGGRVALTRAYHAALEASIRANFRDNGIISCMSHNTDALYLAKQTAVVRASDDFWPKDPASHTVHIISVAYNSLFLGQFMQPDWDMFQSLHPAAEFHGCARAVGGCAVYVSDKPGQHDFGVLRKLVFPDGTVLRARLPGLPTQDCLFIDPARDTKSLLKIWNMNACSGILAAFNCQGAAWCREGRKYAVHDREPNAVTGVISAADVDGLCEVAPANWSGEVVVFSHFSNELLRLSWGTDLVVSLPSLRCEVYTVTPLKSLGGVSFAPVGLVRMYNSGGAVISVQYPDALEQDRGSHVSSSMASLTSASREGASEEATSGDARGDGVRAVVLVRGGGLFVAYASEAPGSVTLDGVLTSCDYDEADGRVSIQLAFQSGKNHTVEFSFSAPTR